MVQNQANALETPGLASLDRLFAIVLWNSKFASAGDACSQIEKATNASKKLKIVHAQLATWKEECVSAIRDFFPRYVELGLAYRSNIRTDLVDWAEERTWDALHGQCGVWKFRKHPGHRSDSVRWWLAVATESNFEVNLPEAEPWCAPRWLAKSLSATDQLLATLTTGLSSRFFSVIDEEKERARVVVALSSALPQIPQLGLSSLPGVLPATATGKPHSTGAGRSTRKPGPAENPQKAKFSPVAGNAWKEKQLKDGRVSTEGLLCIARQLDAAKLVPPKDYLEKTASKQLAEYNRKNAPSKRGAISTWERLVENQDKDQLRAMRKVLSRSARLVRN